MACKNYINKRIYRYIKLMQRISDFKREKKEREKKTKLHNFFWKFYHRCQDNTYLTCKYFQTDIIWAPTCSHLLERIRLQTLNRTACIVWILEYEQLGRRVFNDGSLFFLHDIGCLFFECAYKYITVRRLITSWSAASEKSGNSGLSLLSRIDFPWLSRFSRP